MSVENAATLTSMGMSTNLTTDKSSAALRSSGRRLSLGLVIGIVVGILVLVLFVMAIFWLFCFKGRGETATAKKPRPSTICATNPMCVSVTISMFVFSYLLQY
jgi:hypothetical protein